MPLTRPTIEVVCARCHKDSIWRHACRLITVRQHIRVQADGTTLYFFDDDYGPLEETEQRTFYWCDYCKGKSTPLIRPVAAP